MDETTRFMRRLDRQYQKSSGLTDRRYYSIFYSRVVACRTLVLGFNPGGDPATWDKTVLASQGFYENWEHEYVDCHYRLARAMREFLSNVLSPRDAKDIRRIPKTNLIFRRSKSKAKLICRDKTGRKAIPEAISEAKPTLEKIFRRVSPSVIICEGIDTFDLLEDYYCTDVDEDIDGNCLKVRSGRGTGGSPSMARVYRADQALLHPTASRILLIGIGHPTGFRYSVADRAEVTKRSRLAIRRFGP